MNIQEVLALHKEYLETNGTKGAKANLRWANLSEADLRWANLSGADLSGANLSEANLRWANLSGADLSWANLSGADLSEANLSGADLSEANLRWANLSGADLSGADLSEANLRWANLQIGNFHHWHYTATSETLRIGCEVHTWADWKKRGAAIAKLHDCPAEFKAFWPVLDATRKNLQKRFPKKKEVSK